MNQDVNLKIGINSVSNANYHLDKHYMSSSNLKLLLTDIPKFYQEKILGNREDTGSKSYFDEGSLTHAMILEPEKINRDFAFFQGWTKAGGLYDIFCAENMKKTIISIPQKARCNEYVAAFLRNKTAVSLISGGESEHTVCTELFGIPVKIRADYINVESGYIADVKTSSMPVDVETFRYITRKYKYDLSAALYLMVVEQHYNKSFDFYFPAIAKKDHQCEVFRLSEATRSAGEAQVVRALNIYKACKASGVWENSVDLKKPVAVGDYEILEV